MLKTLRGSFAALLFTLNIIVFPTTLLVVAFFKLIIPIPVWRKLTTSFMHHYLVPGWVGVNSFIIDTCIPTKWDVQGEGELNYDEWYCVVANHRSYVDILILQKVFNKKTQVLKFFMKQELLWSLPFAGWVCWALDFPFMKRYSKEYLKKHPEKKGKDIEVTRKACEKFRYQPTVIANYIEGTRFTDEKHKRQHSPYRYLLKPKAGGLAYALFIMRDYLKKMIDVTIVYSDMHVTLWRFLRGDVEKITVRYNVSDVPEEMYGDYAQDQSFRKSMQAQLNTLWREKDSTIDRLVAEQARDIR